MKITKTASGKKKLTISKREWALIGMKQGWVRSAAAGETPEQAAARIKNIPGSFKAEAVYAIEDLAAGTDDPYLLDIKDKYYPNWSTEDFKKCLDLLEASSCKVLKEAKWKGDAEIDNTGENTEQTVEELKKELADLKKKQEKYKKDHDGDANADLTEKIRQKNFAIRAKTGWKKGKGATK